MVSGGTIVSCFVLLAGLHAASQSKQVRFMLCFVCHQKCTCTGTQNETTFELEIVDPLADSTVVCKIIEYKMIAFNSSGVDRLHSVVNCRLCGYKSKEEGSFELFICGTILCSGLHCLAGFIKNYLIGYWKANI